MTELVVRPYAKAFEKFAAARPDVLCLSADLTCSCEIDAFRERYPAQFLSLGMAEQNMLSFAGGLAMQGYRPFIHTFGVFLYRRPYDQLINSIAYPNRKVRLMGFLPGIMTPGGITHQAIEDIAVMRTIPNMTVLETGDATEVETICEAADAVDGPVYVRVLRGEVPRLFATPFQIGHMRVLGAGTDVLILTSGVSTEDAMPAVAALERYGVSVRHLHISTFKPFDPLPLLAHIGAVRGGIITMENHLRSGGLGTLVSEIMAEHGVGRKLIRLGLDDTFAHGASRAYLTRKYGFDGIALVRAVERLLGQTLPIKAEDLDAARVAAVHSINKAEAL
jgi:transketolase